MMVARPAGRRLGKRGGDRVENRTTELANMGMLQQQITAKIEVRIIAGCPESHDEKRGENSE